MTGINLEFIKPECRYILNFNLSFDTEFVIVLYALHTYVTFCLVAFRMQLPHKKQIVANVFQRNHLTCNLIMQIGTVVFSRSK